MRQWFRFGISLLLAAFLMAGSITFLPAQAAGECGHTYNNGFCTQCGGFEPAVLNSGVYEIANGGQLYWFAQLVNAGQGDANAVLTEDIVINTDVLVDGKRNPDEDAVADFRVWKPIGYKETTTRYQSYVGTFDGQGHTVSGLYYMGDGDCIGLFGYTDDGAVIKNVKLSDSWFCAGEGNGYVSLGAIVGRAIGTMVISCRNESAIVGNGNAVGGIVGEANGCYIENCHNIGSVSGISLVGGIVGTLSGTVADCSNEGSVTGAEDGNAIGGVVGSANHSSDVESDTYIYLCGNTGEVLGGYQIGGILGTGNFCIVEICYNTGAVTGSSELAVAYGAGGVIGDANRSCALRDCYNTGAVTAEFDSDGGIMGSNIQSSAINCYYLESSETDTLAGTAFKTVDQFASGEVAWLLNGSTDEGDLVWKQTIGTDASPRFVGAVVHYDAAAEPPYYNDEIPECQHTGGSATCISGPICDECGLEYGEANPNAHTGGEATCEKGKLCDACGAEYTESLGHSFTKYVSNEDATCTENGTETAKCDRCDKTHTRTVENSAPGHTPAEAVRENEKAATCTEPGSYDEVVYCSKCDAEISRKTVTVEALGHTPAEAVRENEKTATCTEPGSYDEVVYCSVCEDEISRKTVTVDALGHKNDVKDHKCDVCGAELSKCVDENKDYKCDICGAELEKPEEPEKPVIEDVTRLAGANRWETALKVADEMKANLGLEKFNSIIIASGNDFADALAGSYLSTVKNAPILLGWGKGGKYVTLDEANIAYIKANLAENGTVYILGGKNAVPELYENELKGFKVVRLGGANRFETNLLILKEAGVADGSEILVCTSTNFADSLSASATAKPILLVFNEYGKLYGKQPEFLSNLKNCTFTVIGGENAVSAKLFDALKAYGTTTRLAGANRFETSVMVAEKYFKNVDTAVLAYAWNYPDGLCGGSLAYSLKAPLILTMTKYEAKAVEYAKNAGIKVGLVLGGDTLISDDAVRAIFAMDAADGIVKK